MADEEHVNILKQGIPAWNEWRSANPQLSPDLSGAPLPGADLHGANLSRADLGGANLSRADLIGAHLTGATLSRANLFSANLGDANLLGANLSDARLSDANLNFAHLPGANLSRADLTFANLSGANLIDAHLPGANLSGADLSRADVNLADLSRANLKGANLEGANLEGANLEGAILEAANLEGAILEGANLKGAHLNGAILKGARLNGAILKGADFNGADLDGADLDGAYLDGTVLGGGAILIDADLSRANSQEDASSDTVNFEAANLTVTGNDPSLRNADPIAPPTPIAGVISPVDFTATRGRPISARPSVEAQPVFKTTVDRKDHKLRLDLCRTTASQLIEMLDQRRFNLREAYRNVLSDYTKFLPLKTRDRNLLFADQEARILRDLFAEDADILPPEFASRLKALLQAHMALRVFYPALERFYDDVRFGRSDDPLPLDAVQKIAAIVKETPQIFHASVSQALADAAPALPESFDRADGEREFKGLQPPPDLLGTLPTEKAQNYTQASIINRLFAVFLKGEALNKNSEAWIKMGHKLTPLVKTVLDWLDRFFN
jgi:uncharacterized protein YjbI with pentapeptide repeats